MMPLQRKHSTAARGGSLRAKSPSLHPVFLRAPPLPPRLLLLLLMVPLVATASSPESSSESYTPKRHPQLATEPEVRYSVGSATEPQQTAGQHHPHHDHNHHHHHHHHQQQQQLAQQQAPQQGQGQGQGHGQGQGQPQKWAERVEEQGWEEGLWQASSEEEGHEALTTGSLDGVNRLLEGRARRAGVNRGGFGGRSTARRELSRSGSVRTTRRRRRALLQVPVDGEPAPQGIEYRGGAVMVGGVNAYVIWYGAWAVGTKSIIRNFLSSLGEGNALSPDAPTVRGWWEVQTRYYDAAGAHVAASVRLAREARDAYSRGREGLEVADVARVVDNATRSGALPYDADGVYLVLVSADAPLDGFCTSFCAFHTSNVFGPDRAPLKYAFVGDGGGSTPCVRNCANQFGTKGWLPPNGDVGGDAVVNTLAYTLASTVTDPFLDGWSDATRLESGQKCAWNFGEVLKTTAGEAYNMAGAGGQKFLVQTLWDPVRGSCQLQGPSFNGSTAPSAEGSTAPQDLPGGSGSGSGTPAGIGSGGGSGSGSSSGADSGGTSGGSSTDGTPSGTTTGTTGGGTVGGTAASSEGAVPAGSSTGQQPQQHSGGKSHLADILGGALGGAVGGAALMALAMVAYVKRDTLHAHMWPHHHAASRGSASGSKGNANASDDNDTNFSDVGPMLRPGVSLSMSNDAPTVAAGRAPPAPEHLPLSELFKHSAPARRLLGANTGGMSPPPSFNARSEEPQLPISFGTSLVNVVHRGPALRQNHNPH